MPKAIPGRARREAHKKSGAEDGIRTRDLRFTKPLLYQLSYFGADGATRVDQRGAIDKRPAGPPKGPLEIPNPKGQIPSNSQQRKGQGNIRKNQYANTPSIHRAFFV